MKIHFLGTLSGLWPIKGRHHESMIIEIGDKCYLFDAGERCMKTAYLKGIPLLNICNIFISHTHVDHVGGLGVAIWELKKEQERTGKRLTHGKIDMYSPNEKPWKGFQKILEATGKWNDDIKVNCHKVQDGVIFTDENLKLTAFHNGHLGIPEDGNWQSYTFLIEAEGKRILYTGDIKAYSELDAVIGDGCDALIGETGHHDYREVCKYLSHKKVKTLFFTHHGRSIIYDFETPKYEAQKYFDGNVVICEDGMTFRI